MFDYYRIAAITAAILIYACIITKNLLMAKNTVGNEQKRFYGKMIRAFADLSVLLGFFLSPLYEMWFLKYPENYNGFIIGFGTLAYISLCISLFVDIIIRWKYYGQVNSTRDEILPDFIRMMTGMLIIALGGIIFESTTVLTTRSGGGTILQIILPCTALLIYRGCFLLIRQKKAHYYEQKLLERKYRIKKILLRILQGGIVLFCWIRIILRIESGIFPQIPLIPDKYDGSFFIITLITFAWAMSMELQTFIHGRKFQRPSCKNDERKT